MNIPILYEDNHLLVAVKPPGMLSQADRSGDEDILSLLKAYVKERYHKPGRVYLGLVHRLDRPVGGVMVFARTSKAASRLSEQVRSGTFGKQYRAVVCGRPPQGELVHYLIKDEETNTSRVAAGGTPGARRAALINRTIAAREELTLCAITLKTGRSHQIRVQMAAVGCPLYGDQRYNRKAHSGQWVALWAYEVTFCHPTTRQELTFTAPIPSGPPWDAFGNTVERR